jgi:hypothetical protein
MPFSAEELIVALILIVPGFISVNCAIHLFGTSRKFSEFEKSSWSLFLSFIVDALFLWHHNLDTIEEIRGFGILFLELGNIIELFLISIIVGFLCAIFLRVGVVNLFHRTIWLFSERKNYVQSPWEISLRNADWIIVTSDKIEYFGWLAAYSTHEQKREIVLGDPEIIVRDQKGNKSDEIPCGRQLIIPEERIAKVVVVSYKKAFWERLKDKYLEKRKMKDKNVEKSEENE